MHKMTGTKNKLFKTKYIAKQGFSNKEPPLFK